MDTPVITMLGIVILHKVNRYMSDSTEHNARLQQALADLQQRYRRAYTEAGTVPQTEYLDEWQAPCYDGDVRFGLIPWRAVVQQPVTNFNDVERGLESQLHTDVQLFYATYFAADLHVALDGQPMTLSQVMCVEDVERLQRNLIAHVLMKRQLQQDVTLFIGTSDASDDLIVSVHNLTGEVGLEYAGKPQHEKLADNLTEFLQRLDVRVVTDA
ncbi:SecY-interacting protein [Aliidiomarina sedimenti]|uniref:SecY-interacting protein n=2 Tax=Aliidiomarina sedimenti TaxID=1933879 RepID=A0ABY0C2L7_9GAMM|nr:SecY-interacting protein [Aliidiomarina sedimenti]